MRDTLEILTTVQRGKQENEQLKGHPQLQSKFRASLGYTKPYFNTHTHTHTP